MKLLRVSGRYINTSRIDAITMPDTMHANVWVGGRGEPFHAEPGEVLAIQQFVRDAMGGGDA